MWRWWTFPCTLPSLCHMAAGPSWPCCLLSKRRLALCGVTKDIWACDSGDHKGHVSSHLLSLPGGVVCKQLASQSTLIRPQTCAQRHGENKTTVSIWCLQQTLQKCLYPCIHEYHWLRSRCQADSQGPSLAEDMLLQTGLPAALDSRSR